MDQVKATAPTLDRPGRPFYALCAVVALATLALVLLGNPVMAVLPTLLVAVLYGLFKGSLRIPVLIMVTACLILDNPSDHGPWTSPFYTLGELMLIQVKKVIPIDALVLTGVDCTLILLMGIYVYRKAKGLPTDAHPVVKTPNVLILACWASVAVAFLSLVFGLGKGGEFKWAQWQLLKLLRLPLVMLAFSALLPGPSICRTLTKIYIGTALVKAVIAISVKLSYPTAATATSHQDSILFAVAVVALALQILERPGRKAWLLNAVFQPVLVYAMIANDRRLVWVHIAFAGAVVFYSSNWSWIKFRLIRLVISAIPVALIYVAVGWHSSGTGIFKPVGTLKSMADSDTDGSTKWRDLENYNLYKTLESFPPMGTGLGHPFHEVITMPDVTSMYPLEPYVPHNNMLGLWAYTGYLGFSAWWMVLVFCAYYAHRAYRAARAPPERVFCLTTLAALTIYMVQVYGDVGLAAWHGVFIVGTAAIATSKLAMSLGACTEPVTTTAPAIVPARPMVGTSQPPGPEPKGYPT